MRWIVRPEDLGFRTTDDVPPLLGVPAQQRALEAMRVATQIRAAGYNIFCVGLGGADRVAIVREALAEIGCSGQPAPDRAYVTNFGQPEAPRLLELPRGTARRLQRDMDDLIDQLVKHVGLVFEEDRFASRVREITDKHRRQERDVLGKLHERARDAGFTIAEVERGGSTAVDVLFRVRNHLVPMAELERLMRDARAGLPADLMDSEEENREVAAELVALDLAAVQATYDELAEMLRRGMVEARRIARSLQRQVSALEREESLVVIEGAVQEIAARHSGVPGVRRHLEELRTDVLDHLALFKRGATRGGATPPEEMEVEEDGIADTGHDVYVRYRVAVVMDNASRDACPIMVEPNPTARNVFGTIVSIADRMGRQVVDHRSIRPGSLLAADGGYLILDAADVLADPDAWRQLKRVLLSQRLDLRDAVSDRGQPAGLVLRPEPIPVTVKVIMIGDHDTHEFMDSMDQDFRSVFRVRAEFDWLMDRTHENITRMASYLRRLQASEGLLPFTAEAVARLAEYMARLAEHPGRFLSRLEALADPARQASLAALRARSRVVDGAHVRAALAAGERRSALAAERVREAIEQKRIIINTSGRAVGQVNGLGVVSTTDHVFGHPMRITAVIGKGDQGLVNIEREVKLSGNLHDKGMFLVQGYLTHAYGRQVPLELSASVAFEQLYGGIEGDSASAAEIFALLSALSGLAVDQGFGVTGSVNQVGEVQPVGGVNEKVEGFYDACTGPGGSTKRLTGQQGVIIPRANVGDLMLREDIVEAARQGLFHVHGIEHVEEGLEILMGRPAGRADARGRYPDDSIHGLALAALRDIARPARPARGTNPPRAPKTGKLEGSTRGRTRSSR